MWLNPPLRTIVWMHGRMIWSRGWDLSRIWIILLISGFQRGELGLNIDLLRSESYSKTIVMYLSIMIEWCWTSLSLSTKRVTNHIIAFDSALGLNIDLLTSESYSKTVVMSLSTMIKRYWTYLGPSTKRVMNHISAFDSTMIRHIVMLCFKSFLSVEASMGFK